MADGGSNPLARVTYRLETTTTLRRRRHMSIAKISEISATSTKSFEDAIQQGITRATRTLRNVTSAWIKEQHLRVENGRPAEYQVNMMVTFVLDE
jgi:hypothetical protein